MIECYRSYTLALRRKMEDHARSRIGENAGVERKLHSIHFKLS
jgi:hypothetical protein